MRVHFDVTHPAHVHLFRNAIESLEAEGHDVGVTSREKEVTTDLLDAYGIEHEVLSAKGDSALGLGPEWGMRSLRTLQYVRRFDPDVVVSQLNPAAVSAATMAGTPSVVFHDSETAGRLAKVLGPMSDVVCSPVGVRQQLRGDHRRYDGFHELAYLHPDRFEPDPDVLTEHGVDPEEPYAVLRFVSMGAYHDVGARGLGLPEKLRLATELSQYGTVYVSSEAEPPEGLPAEPVPVPPEAIHHLLAYADVFVGDSDTMAIESAILGTPTVRVERFDGGLGCVDRLSNYGLIRTRDPDDGAVEAALELAADPDAGERWRRRRLALLEDTVDVSAYMLATIREVAQ